ncbi:secretory carrier-associated membrane protein 2-like [Lycium ferocissimum]|uniref:secretory carrier-associated membrane protein 2-like n=1 Tax=Lycium ferocissimum TaxID=112874 RepID=UPI002814F8A7|nr:secretory carrier-associated membrane protein 2-like [Lycium ferocissimum]
MIMYHLAYALFYSLRNLQNPASVLPAINSRLSPLPHEPADYDRGATVDIPLDNSKDQKNKEKELQAKEAEMKKREQDLKRREDAIARGSSPV